MYAPRFSPHTTRRAPVAMSGMLGLVSVILLVCGTSLHAGDPAGAGVDELAEALRRFDAGTIVLGPVAKPVLAGMLSRDAAAKLRMAQAADTRAWEQLRSRADWDRFVAPRLAALRASLGPLAPKPADLEFRTLGTITGDGYVVEKVTYRSRPGQLITANLYRPQPLPPRRLPAILVSHLHQYPKFNTYCQAIGMSWARAGTVVLIPDHIGHGERRQHPFGSDADYAQPFPKTRHDYHARYDLGIQLHLAGESLMGWLVADMMRGVDLLAQHPAVDPQRLLILSEPASGGDVAAVTAALDTRLQGAIVNNFGGPQPETVYPLPRDAEHSFEFAGTGSWESTRCLRLSARDGFLHGTIIASIAPRKLLYTHEFTWDKAHDPVWKRLRTVYDWHNAPNALEGTAGRGFVVGTPPLNTHWLAENREAMYPILERWFGCPSPQKEYRQPLLPTDLLCFRDEAGRAQQPVHRLLGELCDARLAALRTDRQAMSLDQRCAALRTAWSQILGDVREGVPERVGAPFEPTPFPGATGERWHLSVEPGIVVPAVLLRPDGAAKPPVVVALSAEGKQHLLARHSSQLATFLRNGIAVCLLDVRGTGESSPGGSRDRNSPLTSVAATELMVGETLVGGRLRDLRAVLAFLKQRSDLDTARLGLWGLSTTPTNPLDKPIVVSHSASERPAVAEPLGGLLALLGALFEDRVRAVLIHGGLGDYRSAYLEAQCHLPYDVIIPGLLTVGDLPDLAGAVAPRPLRLERMVNSLNQNLAGARLAEAYAPASAVYHLLQASPAFEQGITDQDVSPGDWFARQFAGAPRSSGGGNR